MIDALAAMPPAVLRRGLAEGVTARDLRSLCKRIGYSTTGSEAQVAARLMAAIEEPAARITRWRPFEEARTFARSLQLSGQAEWFAFARRRLRGRDRLPDDIPTAPYAAYADTGWTNWGDFLGTDNPARQRVQYRPFARARAYVRALGLANATEWKALCRKKVGNRRVLPRDIPAAPDKVYADTGWVSFGDWLGTGRVHASRMTYRNYDRARMFVRTLGIRTEPEWRAYCRGEIHRSNPRPLDIPSNPHRTYRDRGWTSWGLFLGTFSVAAYKRAFRPYDAARAYVRTQGVAGSKEWRAWCAAGKRPADIPGAPDQVYLRRGWINWTHFLGGGRLRHVRSTA